jgi:hypothetical protein
MNGPVIALCALSALAGAGLTFLIMKARILRMQQKFRASSMLLVADPSKAKRPRKSPTIQTMTIEERTNQLRAQLKMQ